ncbi:flagellar hook assembly protein FlgD [Arcobacter sp. LA11]|uniref:flagellar hook assembly protein FlgD n=1 Tax=Arcobacter sp. LA11 TaxID=1898176 RepID=UPI00093532A5|nr:flagellar hook capping FlgD N-terminal domain-containing protein [Arcobacter sp. LA11]
MAVENVTVNSSTGIDGSSYTSSISNDQLTNEDFLTLMITELKLQDPTKPMDSQKMLSTQMQMSTIETNIQLANSMKALEGSIASMSLSNAVDFMGKKIDAVVDMPVKDSSGNNLKDEEGNTITEKVKASFLINTVQMQDGVALLESSELLGFKDRLLATETGGNLNYDYETGQIKDADGKDTDYYVKLDESGRFDLDSSGKVVIVDKDGKTVTPKYSPEDSEDTFPKFAYYRTDEIYSPNSTFVKYEDIVKIY